MREVALELGFVEIASRDIERWARFATEIVGMATEVVGPPGGRVLLMRADDKRYRVAVRESDEDRFLRTVYRVDGESGLDQLAQRLERASVRFERLEGAYLPSGRRGEAFLDFQDPSGHDIRVSWAAPEDSVSPLPSPAGVDFTGHRLGALGHVVLLVPDLDKSMAFYTECLGFRLTDFIGDGPSRLAFLRCNERHHTVALMAGAARVDHIMVEFATLDDVARVFDAARAHPGVVASELGRHSNDRAISFYVRTPLPGLEIEVGTQGIDVGEPWTPDVYASGSIWGHKRILDYPSSPVG